MLKKLLGALLFVGVANVSWAVGTLNVSINDATDLTHLHVIWTTSQGSSSLTFFAQQDESTCSTFCYSVDGSCASLLNFAQKYSDYRAFWNKFSGCSIVNEKIFWPGYNEVSRVGGHEIFGMGEGARVTATAPSSIVPLQK